MNTYYKVVLSNVTQLTLQISYSCVNENIFAYKITKSENYNMFQSDLLLLALFHHVHNHDHAQEQGEHRELRQNKNNY